MKTYEGTHMKSYGFVKQDFEPEVSVFCIKALLPAIEAAPFPERGGAYHSGPRRHVRQPEHGCQGRRLRTKPEFSFRNSTSPPHWFARKSGRILEVSRGNRNYLFSVVIQLTDAFVEIIWQPFVIGVKEGENISFCL